MTLNEGYIRIELVLNDRLNENHLEVDVTTLIHNSTLFQSRQDVLEILDKLWPGLPDKKRMIASICQLSAPEDITEEDLIRGAESIEFSYRPYNTYDDDCYWLAQSPFNKKWYLFVACFVCSYLPSRPAYEEEEYPMWFDK
ncbi:MAG: hypothetical protein IPN70_02960 [Candidatus Moraniibacteriota bacterium]|nr:MAG: hypothetical protein IPN70_02960 [Candidatus Moranbacteria bacterium]